jgi:hypothetical protein
MQTYALGKLCQLGQASLCGLQQREAIAHENRASAMKESNKNRKNKNPFKATEKDYEYS